MAYVKYPRTLHLPTSPGRTSDDKVLTSIDHLLGKHCIITEKRDGENTSIYTDHYHARSIDSRAHPSRKYVKMLQDQVGPWLSPGWRVCGENLYAKHSIGYDNLNPFYFEVFSIWDEHNRCMSWEDTKIYCGILNLTHVPVISEGILTEEMLEAATAYVKAKSDSVEGYVVRVADSFAYDEFSMSLAKYVRANHVQTDKHWMHQAIVPNKAA